MKYGSEVLSEARILMATHSKAATQIAMRSEPTVVTLRGVS